MDSRSTEKKETHEPMTVVSLGRHTRLGDALEFALEGIPFVTMEPEELPKKERMSARLLFAASADKSGENVPMHRLVARFSGGEYDLYGYICAAVADGEQGGAVHLEAIQLLLAANAAGAGIIPRPLLDAGRDLRALADGAKGTPFERYCALARELVLRLNGSTSVSAEQRRVRFLTALDEGTANDWRGALNRICSASGGALTDEADAEETLLLCENTGGLPDEKTLSLLDGGGWIRFLIASPTPGSDLYTAALFERACVRGNYGLPPRAVAVFEGKSAVEAHASGREMEKLPPLFKE
jgi:hypothetical protein